ncbi:MAG UNVERIFIED_CONTAM: type II toxin-antitoxin system Phd/YefM family antitoxin [Rickettsiaceae bacterium]|jgi:prevent-host-death family protein
MRNTKKEISASEFKKYFLRLVDEVENRNSSFIITKRKIPIARIIPLDNKKEMSKSHFGCMKGSIKINEDIVSFDSSDDWESNNE